MQLRRVRCFDRADLGLRKTRRLRVSVRVKDWRRAGRIARPKTDAAHFLRVRFPRHAIGQMWNSARMRRSGPAGEASDGEIKASPKEMNGAALATETGAKLRQDPRGLDKDAPESVRVFGIVRSMGLVLIERNRIDGLLRHPVDLHAQTEFVEGGHHRAIKLRDRLRL